MRQFTASTLLMVSALVGCSGGSEPDVATPVDDGPQAIADTIYTNGKIYTVNEAQPWAEAVAIKDGKFLVVGSNTDVESVTGDSTRVVDLGGRMAMPGLIDVHNHATGASMGKANIFIENPNDQDAILAEIKAYADANPDIPFIRGEAWNLGVFPDDSPRKELLDEIVPDRPVYIYSQTGHEAWVNSKTLELIGVDANSEQTGKILWDVDPETNEPTGRIKEFAMALVEQALPPTPPERIAPKLQETLAQFSEQGFTTLKLAEGEISWVEAANLLDTAGKLEVRLFPSWFYRAHNGAMTPELALETAARWEDFRTELVYPRYVKTYWDGGPNSYTSVLDEDYVGRPGFKGEPYFPTEDWIDVLAEVNAQGLGLIIHVQGDAGSRELVYAFEQIRERNGDNGVPLHFSHAVMTKPAEIERLAGVSDVCIDFINLQYPHPAIEGSFLPPIGDERYQLWLNARAAAESGIPYAFGSDWPAALEPILDGFFQMQAWVTRRDPGNPDYGKLNIDQALTLEQAVYGHTQGGAECLGFDWPDKVGSIIAGKFADFIVIDQNIFEVPIDTLKDTSVDLTVLGGKVVFDRNKDPLVDIEDEERERVFLRN